MDASFWKRILLNIIQCMGFMYILPQPSFLLYNMGFDIAYLRNGCARQNWNYGDY